MFNTNTINLQEPAVSETLTHLAAELKRQPHFTALEKAYREFQADQHAQDLLTRARTLQQQLRYSWTDEDRAELDQLIDDFSQIPAVVAYNLAERDLRDLLRAVDMVIGEAAGVKFAANAKRSCCGG